MCHAQNANETTTDPKMDSALAAPSESIAPIQQIGPSTMPESSPITPGRPSGSSGYNAGESTPADPSPQNSTYLEPPSKGSTLRWKQPKTVKDFANQASVVCTMLLNGKIDLETARTYSGVARVVAQAISSEVTKSRFLNQKPAMDFDGEVFDSED